MWPFKCKHPFADLAVGYEATERIENDHRVLVTYHLHCQRCNRGVDLSFVRLTEKYFSDTYGVTNIKPAAAPLDLFQ